MLEVGDKPRKRVATGVGIQEYAQPARRDFQAKRMPDMQVDRVGLPLTIGDLPRHPPKPKRLLACEQVGYERVEVLDLSGMATSATTPSSEMPISSVAVTPSRKLVSNSCTYLS